MELKNLHFFKKAAVQLNLSLFLEISFKLYLKLAIFKKLQITVFRLNSLVLIVCFYFLFFPKQTSVKFHSKKNFIMITGIPAVQFNSRQYQSVVPYVEIIQA